MELQKNLLKTSTIEISENFSFPELGLNEGVVHGFGHTEAAYTNSPFLKPVWSSFALEYPLSGPGTRPSTVHTGSLALTPLDLHHLIPMPGRQSGHPLPDAL